MKIDAIIWFISCYSVQQEIYFLWVLLFEKFLPRAYGKVGQ